MLTGVKKQMQTLQRLATIIALSLHSAYIIGQKTLLQVKFCAGFWKNYLHQS